MQDEECEVSEKTVNIYALFDPREPEKVRYVGKTGGTLENRLNQHRCKALRGATNTHKCNWIRKIISEGTLPCIKLIKEVGESVWQEAEISEIANQRSLGHPLTNTSEGGEGGSCGGWHHTEDAKQRIAEAQKGNTYALGKKLSASHCENISKANTGRLCSQDTRDKISKAQKGKPKSVPVSESTRLKRSASLRGKKQTPETVAKRVASRKKNGRTMSEEARARISNSLMGNKMSKETIEKREATKKANRLKTKLRDAKILEDDISAGLSLEEGFSIWL